MFVLFVMFRKWLDLFRTVSHFLAPYWTRPNHRTFSVYFPQPFQHKYIRDSSSQCLSWSTRKVYKLIWRIFYKWHDPLGVSFRSRKYARVWREVANFGPYRPPRSKTELLSTPFLIMITTRTSGVSGKLTWWFITLLTFTFHCPSNSLIDPFPSSQSILYFHNFRNQLTWPPRRLQKSLLFLFQTQHMTKP